MRTGSTAFLCPSKAEIVYNIQIRSKCKILVMILDDNSSLFRMMHFVLLQVESYMLKMEVSGWKTSFRK
jgi:hypothetical protein